MVADWQFRLLNKPARCTDSIGAGFFDGKPAGYGVQQNGNYIPCMWNDQTPERIEVGGLKNLDLRYASSGEAICGSYTKSGKQYAVSIRPDTDGSLIIEELHPKDFQWSVATDRRGSVVVGYGLPKGKRGDTPIIRAIVWKSDGSVLTLKAGGENEGYAEATDGVHVGGWAGFTSCQRVALWTADGSSVVDLTPDGYMGRLIGVSGDIQVGNLVDMDTYSKSCGAIWRGSAATYQSLTPAGFESSHVHACLDRIQVGSVTRHLLPERKQSLLTEAILWQGSSQQSLLLHKLLPSEWNASSASAAMIDDDRIQVVGTVSTITIQNPGSDNELHTVERQSAFIMEGPLASLEL